MLASFKKHFRSKTWASLYRDVYRDDANIFSSGGPAGLTYGFIIAWFSTFSVYLVIAEMASLLVPMHKTFDIHWLNSFQSTDSRRTVFLGLSIGTKKVQTVR